MTDLNRLTKWAILRIKLPNLSVEKVNLKLERVHVGLLKGSRRFKAQGASWSISIKLAL